jgi:hypothetical protein
MNEERIQKKVLNMNVKLRWRPSSEMGTTG